MKVSEMNEEKRKEYFREAKRRSRDKDKQEKLKLGIPHADDYLMPEQLQRRLNEYSEQLTETIQTELTGTPLTRQDEYIIDAVASVSFGLENRITQIVFRPHGMLVAGWFADGAVSAAIEHVHRYPHLLNSEAFAVLYSNFLHAVDKWSTSYSKYADPEAIAMLKAELAGEYKLADSPQPEREPTKIEEIPMPADTEILTSGRSKLLQQLRGSDVQMQNL